MEGRHTTLKLDSYVFEQIMLSRGITPSCQLSGIIFQSYNVDLVDMHKIGKGGEVIAFMDDTLLLAKGKSLSETNAKVKRMMVREGGVSTGQSLTSVNTW